MCVLLRGNCPLVFRELNDYRGDPEKFFGAARWLLRVTALDGRLRLSRL